MVRCVYVYYEYEYIYNILYICRTMSDAFSAKCAAGYEIFFNNPSNISDIFESPAVCMRSGRHVYYNIYIYQAMPPNKYFRCLAVFPIFSFIVRRFCHHFGPPSVGFVTNRLLMFFSLLSRSHAHLARSPPPAACAYLVGAYFS